jgi:hypothetical protein
MLTVRVFEIKLKCICKLGLWIHSEKTCLCIKFVLVDINDDLCSLCLYSTLALGELSCTIRCNDCLRKYSSSRNILDIILLKMHPLFRMKQCMTLVQTWVLNCSKNFHSRIVEFENLGLLQLLVQYFSFRLAYCFINSITYKPISKINPVN